MRGSVYPSPCALVLRDDGGNDAAYAEVVTTARVVRKTGSVESIYLYICVYDIGGDVCQKHKIKGCGGGDSDEQN